MNWLQLVTIAHLQARSSQVRGDSFLFHQSEHYLAIVSMQLEYFLFLAAALFCIGIFGLVTSRNAIRVLMSIELLLNAVNLNLLAFSNYLDPSDIRGQVFSVFVITIAAAESAVGLAIVLAIYRNRDTVDMEQFNLLKW